MFECVRCQSTSWSVKSLMDDLQGYCTCNACGTHQKMHKEVKEEPKHLYTPTDVAKVRKILYEEQEGKDALTGLELPTDKLCLDHCHQSQFVRGVLHRQVNAALGKLEGVHTRYLSYWYEGTLPDFLRQAADYLEKEQDTRYVHPGWLKKAQTMFNTLSEGDKKAVLEALGKSQGGNSTERKKIFKAALMTRKFTYKQIKAMIEERKKV